MVVAGETSLQVANAPVSSIQASCDRIVGMYEALEKNEGNPIATADWIGIEGGRFVSACRRQLVGIAGSKHGYSFGV